MVGKRKHECTHLQYDPLMSSKTLNKDRHHSRATNSRDRVDVLILMAHEVIHCSHAAAFAAVTGIRSVAIEVATTE